MDHVNGEEKGDYSAQELGITLRHNLCRSLWSLAGGFSPAACIPKGVTMWRVRCLRMRLTFFGRSRHAEPRRQPWGWVLLDYGCSKIFLRCFSYSSRLSAPLS